LLAQLFARLIDRVLDPVVDSSQRGIVGWRCRVVDDGIDELARRLPLPFDLGVCRLVCLQASGIALLIGLRLHLRDHHPPHRYCTLERLDVGPRKMVIGREIFVVELVEEMADRACHERGDSRGEHHQHDEADGDADDLPPDRWPEHPGHGRKTCGWGSLHLGRMHQTRPLRQQIIVENAERAVHAESFPRDHARA